MAEAVAAGCAALAPDALAYPEVLAGLGPEALYPDADTLVRRLVELARDPGPLRRKGARDARRAAILAHDAGRTARELDGIVDELRSGSALTSRGERTG
jgi:glycosyltransferase involved in cell wall biosynthesis